MSSLCIHIDCWITVFMRLPLRQLFLPLKLYFFHLYFFSFSFRPLFFSSFLFLHFFTTGEIGFSPITEPAQEIGRTISDISLHFVSYCFFPFLFLLSPLLVFVSICGWYLYPFHKIKVILTDRKNEGIDMATARRYLENFNVSPNYRFSLRCSFDLRTCY